MNKDDTFTAGVAISLLLHLVFFLTLANSPRNLPDTKEYLEVSVVSPEDLVAKSAKRQIVTPPDQAKQSPVPPVTNHEAEKDLMVPQESVKRGESGGVPGSGERSPPPRPESRAQPETLQRPVPATEGQAAKQPPEKENSSQNTAENLAIASDESGEISTSEKKSALKYAKPKAPTKLSKVNPPAETKPNEKLVLRLDGATTQELFKAPAKAAPAKAAQEKVQPFSRPQGSGARFLGESGSSDFLPNLPDGDLTLLNAKANQYAVFVRRVAEQVFAELRTVGWAQLSRSDIVDINSPVTVSAAMNLSGSLVSITITTSSSSQRFDAALLAAVKRGGKDSNPPASAALADKMIHFTFESQSWSAVAPEPRNGGMTERRWLYLGTGLD